MLKLRTRQQLRNNLFAELGADLNASKMAITPKAALEYRVIPHMSLTLESADSRRTQLSEIRPIYSRSKQASSMSPRAFSLTNSKSQ